MNQHLKNFLLVFSLLFFQTSLAQDVEEPKPKKDKLKLRLKLAKMKSEPLINTCRGCAYQLNSEGKITIVSVDNSYPCKQPIKRQNSFADIVEDE